MPETPYITSYNGYELSDYGMATPEVAGVHSGPNVVLSKLWLPGASRAHVTEQRREREEMVFGTVIADTGGSHGQWVTNINAVKAILFPDDRAYHELIVADRTGVHIMAKPTQMPVELKYLPNLQHAVQLQTVMDVYPYWEDDTEESVTISVASQLVVNAGHMRCYPTYTCNLIDNMGSGLSFTVGAITFEYEGALVNGDSLVVDSDQDCPDVELNGTRDWANCADDMAVLPFLAKGNNLVSLSDHTKFHLTVAYKQRYW